MYEWIRMAEETRELENLRRGQDSSSWRSFKPHHAWWNQTFDYARCIAHYLVYRLVISRRTGRLQLDQQRWNDAWNLQRIRHNLHGTAQVQNRLRRRYWPDPKLLLLALQKPANMCTFINDLIPLINLFWVERQLDPPLPRRLQRNFLPKLHQWIPLDRLLMVPHRFKNDVAFIISWLIQLPSHVFIKPVLTYFHGDCDLLRLRGEQMGCDGAFKILLTWWP